VNNCQPNPKKVLKKWSQTLEKEGPGPPLQRPQNRSKSSKNAQKVRKTPLFRDFGQFPGSPGNTPSQGLRTQEIEKQHFPDKSGPDPGSGDGISHPECQTANNNFSQLTITKNHLPKPSRTKKQYPN